MQTFRKADTWLRFVRDTHGQDLIEYALLCGMVAVAAAAIFPTTLMPHISTVYSKVNSIMSQANSTGA